MSKLSVIIPSYNDPYLCKTIDGVFKASEEDVEIIVFLDYFTPAPLVQDNRILYITSGINVGMRSAINTAVSRATGKYIMKLDSHCKISNGFDVKMKADLKEDWISVPSRYSLNVKKWKKFNGPIDHLYLKFPDNFKKEIGFRYRLFSERAELKKNEMITDIIGFQGSCWFMHKSFFKKIGGLDESMFGSFGSEAHELSMKTWLTTNGKVVRNRNVWYAHYSPPTRKRRSLRKSMLNNMKKAFRLDMCNEWPGQIRSFKWLIDKFGPFPGWPDNWYDDLYISYLKMKGYL